MFFVVVGAPRASSEKIMSSHGKPGASVEASF